MADPFIELRRIEHVTVMTLVAGKANAFDPPLLDALGSGIKRVLADGARAIVITGEGNVFSGGLALPTLITYTRGQMLELMGEGVPLLTAVGEKYLESWRRFTDGAGAELSANPESLDAWFESLGK